MFESEYFLNEHHAISGTPLGDIVSRMIYKSKIEPGTLLSKGIGLGREYTEIIDTVYENFRNNEEP